MARRERFRTDPFTDLLFNALLGFTFLFMATIVFVNPVARQGNVALKAEYIVTLTWDETRADDLDLWVEDPLGEVVSYLQRDANWLHLDRDDRGDLTDTIEVAGQRIVHPINQEIVTLRGIIAGEYVVNVYFYDSESGAPITATLKVDKVNPELETVFVDRVELRAVDDELTVLRFTVAADGSLAAVNRLPKRLTPYALEG